MLVVRVRPSWSPSGGMADTLDLKSNPTKGIGSSPMMGKYILSKGRIVKATYETHDFVI